jgi:hypothetical protein
MSARPAAAQPPQRLCPRCSTLARTTEPRCPWCGTSYRRRGPWGTAAAAALAAVAATLAGVALMFGAFGDELEGELDQQVETVRTDFERDVQQLQQDIEESLDRRLPAPPP